MFMNIQVKQELTEEPPAPSPSLTAEERRILSLSQCHEDRCNEELRVFQKDVLAEGVILPDGWKCKRHLRCSGSLMGKAYTVYHSPEGYICRSKVAARERLGLPRQPAAAATSGKVRDKTADKNHSQQALKQPLSGRVTKPAAFARRLLSDLTESELPPHLLQVQITCLDTRLNIARAGIWYPCLNEVECQGSCCTDKPAHARIMKCSGQNSFEAHCGKNPKQWHWRDSFKVNEEAAHRCKNIISSHTGFKGMTVQRYMGSHGISLTKSKKSSTPQPNPPSSSTPSLCKADPQEPLADPEIASRKRQRPESPGSRVGGPNQAAHQSGQQPQHSPHDMTRIAPDADPCAARQNLPFPTADAADHTVDGVDEAFHEMQSAELPVEDACSDAMEDTDSAHGTKADCIGIEVQDVQLSDMQRAVEEETAARSKERQAKLKKEHKNKTRSLRRQLKTKDELLAAAKQEVANVKQQLAEKSTEVQALPGSCQSDGQPAGAMTHDAAGKCEAGTGVAADGDMCQCCKAREAMVSQLEKALADERLKGDVAAAEYADLLKDNSKLKQEVYKLKILGC